MTFEILAQEPEGDDRVRLIYQFLDGETVHGPFMSIRFADENPKEFLISGSEALQDSINAPVPKPEDQLREMILAYDAATVKLALSIDDQKLADIKAAQAVADVAVFDVEAILKEGK